ncbi:DUF2225 domain-containing protein [Desulfitobacterium metallireducens]|uniref:DUF2225 domain-containing protein n=1 Tax=Desulfitobacterium metallireducens DSM 15288 TaxID=871968 RepID=W0E5J0_9FIRM|nr:DUF2225 domain-containing protein [Desulfitobacterium metallireducens]AHF06130.1 hypothetical protein DESME_02935 [Desulfitobacterium metallireducens DSM 15288]
MINDLQPFYEKSITCLFCGESFTTKKIRSKFSAAYKTDADFCPHYKDNLYNSLYYHVSVCPSCGFAFNSEFSKDFTSVAKNSIQKNIAEKWQIRDLGSIRDNRTAIETYKLAILSASLKGERHFVIAGLCLRLSWIYRQENQPDDEQRFLNLAIKEYDASYLYSDFVKSWSALKMLYILGELNRQVGEFKQAISYFTKIVNDPDRNQDRLILNRTREQWALATEQYRNSHPDDNPKV